jgi:16S rRNA (uracil1498-N3)-methyltransferase
MPRIFIPDSEIHNSVVTLRDEKARYLATVLRCKEGDPLVVKDDKGNAYIARITGAERRKVTVEILQRQDLTMESSLRITLLQGMLKGEKMDLVIQKATELGVSEIRPVITERSQVRETRRLSRWKKIAEEAARQSGRDVVPLIHDPVRFVSVFAESGAFQGKGIIFWEKSATDLSPALKRFRGSEIISLFTGPEGGFSQDEITAASKAGFIDATLGIRILRAETAAIVAVSVVQYVLGDLGTLE